MNKLATLIIFITLTLSASFSFAENYARGTIAGSCTMQADGNFNIVHNGAVDSSGNKLATVPEGVGGATWPVILCPSSGSNLKTQCAAGWKLVQTSVVQMDCRASSSAPMCWTYWITHGCAKL